jgi:hypothetical protein
MIARATLLGLSLAALSACEAGVNGPGDAGGRDDTPACCSARSCGPGLVCTDCSCVPEEDCCVGLGCEGQGRVCSGCACAAPDDDGDGDGVPAEDDCDDGCADVHPGAEESCNGRDDDCDGRADEEGCAIGSCCAGACVRTDEDPGNCGGCGVSCDDGDFCTADRCEGGACLNEACGPGTDCCVAGPCYECCADADCDDGEPCTTDRCSGGACTRGDGCGAGEQCCDGSCAACCSDDDCGQGTRCEGGECACGPAPHWQEVDGECRPSCGAALDAAGFYNNGGGCCPTACTMREASSTWDCAYCCETADGVSACQ